MEEIKGEKELKQLTEEDMIKLQLNLGQRIKLRRYINFLQEKEITITITEKSSDDETLKFLKNELNFIYKM